jgi:hypothetical protein
MVENASKVERLHNIMGFSMNYAKQQKISALKSRFYQDGRIKEIEC